MKKSYKYLLIGLLSSSSAFAQTHKVIVNGIERSLPVKILSIEEASRVSGAMRPTTENTIKNATSSSLPKQVDLRRNMPAVRDQGARGTCTAFAATTLFDVTYGSDFSEQCLAYGSSMDDPTSILTRVNHVSQYGLYKESECKYQGREEKRGESASQLPTQGSFSPSFAGMVIGGSDINIMKEIKSQVARNKPVAIAMIVNTNDWFNNNPVIDTPTRENNTCITTTECSGHAIVIVGYDDVNNRFLIN